MHDKLFDFNYYQPHDLHYKPKRFYKSNFSYIENSPIFPRTTRPSTSTQYNTFRNTSSKKILKRDLFSNNRGIISRTTKLFGFP